MKTSLLSSMFYDFLYWFVFFFFFFNSFSLAQETPPFWRQETLLGDLGGLRPALEEHGMTLDMVYTSEFFQNLHGGLNTHEAGEYRGLIDIAMEIDTGAAGWWENGTFFLLLQEGHGRGITTDHVGDFQTLSNIDADDYKQISEIWYRHSFWDDRLWFKIGKMDGNDDFAGMEYGAEFINSSAGYTPTIPLTTYPNQDWGAVIGARPVDWFGINAGVYQGDPNGGRSIGNTLDNLEGPMILVEPSFHYRIGNLPGRVSLAGWWNGSDCDYLSPPNPDDRASESYGLFFTWEQQVWKEVMEKEDDPQGIGFFAQYGHAPENRSEANEYIGGGVQWTGLIPTRDEDVWGLGVFNVTFSEKGGFVDEKEIAIEMFYKYQALAWLTFKPDVQYIQNPGGNGNKDALAVGLRWEIVF